MKSVLLIVALLLVASYATITVERVEVTASPSCTICELVVSTVESFIKENKTEQEIEKLLDALCDKLPVFGKQCEAMVDAYLPMIIDWIVNAENPQKFCTQIGLCPKASVTDGGNCMLCKLVVSYVEQYLEKNNTQQEIEKLLDKVCDALPLLKAQCKALVHEYLPELIEFIENKENPDTFCAQIGLCPKSVPEAGPGCVVCELVVSAVEKFLKENKTEEEIEKLLDKLCDTLPVFKDQCKAMINAYLDKIIDWIENKEDPKTLCQQLGLCAANLGTTQCLVCEMVIQYVEQYLKEEKTETEIEKLLDEVCDVIPIQNIKSQCKSFVHNWLPKLIDYIENKEDPKTFCTQIGLCQAEQPEAGPACVVCELVVSAVEKYLKENQTEQQIEQLLDKLCDTLPVFKDQCKAMINAYLDKIIDWIENQEDPNTFCRQVGLCGAKLGDNKPCVLCELVVSAVEKYIENGNTEQEIIELLDDLCNKLPVFQSECISFVNSYIDLIFQWIENNEPPAKVCQQIGMCKKTEEPKAAPLCTLCELVISSVEKWLREKKTEEEIEKLLDQVCALFGSFRSQCDEFVDAYLDLAIQYIENNLPPEKFCAMINACPKQQPRVADTSQCMICKMVIQLVEDALADGKTEKDIEEACDKLCDAMPTFLRTICTDFINDFIEDAIKYIENDLPPTKFCGMMNLCPKY